MLIQFANTEIPTALPLIPIGNISEIISQVTGPRLIAKNAIYVIKLITVIIDTAAVCIIYVIPNTASEAAIPVTPIIKSGLLPTISISQRATIVIITFIIPTPNVAIIDAV